MGAGQARAATPEQAEMLRAMAVVIRRKLRAGEGRYVSTAELTGVTGRYGQVIGRILTGAADRGLVARREDRAATLTRAGLDWLISEGSEG